MIALIGALAALLVIAALVGTYFYLARTAGEVVLIRERDDTITIRTPLGRAHARLVLHDHMGRAYEVRYRFRGEPDGVVYTPPTLVLLRGKVQRMVDERRGLSEPR